MGKLEYVKFRFKGISKRAPKFFAKLIQDRIGFEVSFSGTEMEVMVANVNQVPIAQEVLYNIEKAGY